MINTKLNIESIIDGSIEKDKLAESVQESLNKVDNAMQGITINGESKTPDENGVVDLGNTYVTTLAYTATSKIENTDYPWDEEEGEYTFGVPIIEHEFSGNTGVIYFRGRITTIGYGAFANCGNLTSITIPDSVTTIGEGAFFNCSSLTSVTIPDSVTTIGDYAFKGCSSLTSVTIPDSVTSIGSNAFSGCTCELVVNCNIPSTSDYSYGAFYGSKFTSVTIGDSVTSIGDYAFFDCSNLTSVTIPDSVTTIGDGAFFNCNNLTSVYCKATTPPAGGSRMFNNNASGRKIYVPTESVEAYKSASGWSSYADAIVGYRFNADFNDYYTKSETEDIIEDAISDLADVAQSGSYNDLSDKPTIPFAVTESTVRDWGFTKNTGTITGVSANGTSVATSGVANIPAASALNYGVTKLSSAINSASTSLAATPSAVKSAYDLANNAYNLADSKYLKPADGISYEDLHEDVQTSLGKADSAVQQSDVIYEIVTFTIDDIINAIASDINTINIDYTNRDDFRSNKPLMIKKSSDSTALYPLTYTRSGTPMFMSYSGTCSCVVEGVTYEFDIKYPDSFADGKISNIIQKNGNIYVADFTIADLDGIISDGYSTSINISALHEAIKNRKIIIVRDDVDVYGINNILTGSFYSAGEWDIINFTITAPYGSWVARNLKLDITTPEQQSYNLNNSNTTFNYTIPYVLDFTMVDIEDLDEEYIDKISYNSFNLYNAIKNGRQILIKESSTSSTMLTVTASSYIGGESKFALGIFDGYRLWRIMVYLSEQGGQEPKSIIYNDMSTYGLPYINPDSGGYKPLVSSGDFKTINNNSIYSTSAGNIYTYYRVSIATRDGSYSLSPNNFYKFGTPTNPLTSLNIALGAEINGVVNEYIFEIYTSAEVVPTLDLPDDIKWVSGDAPVLEENKTYQISIINKLGAVLSWDNV